MSRRLTEERFATASVNAINKMNALSSGKKQFLLKSKRVITTMLEEHRNIDARKEAKSLIYNQYIADIYEGLVKILNVLSQNSANLPKCTTIPKSLDLEIYTVVFFSERVENIKELIDLKKMFIGHFGNLVVAEATENTIDQKLVKKYRSMNSIPDKMIDDLIEVLKPKGLTPTESKGLNIPTTDPSMVMQKQQFPQMQQSTDSYSRFASMNQSDDSRFPSFDSAPQNANKFPSFGEQPSANKFPSFGDSQPNAGKFPDFGNTPQQQNKFPSFGEQPSANKFPDFGAAPLQQNKFPSFGDSQPSANKFPDFGAAPQQQNQFPSFGGQQQNQFQSMGTFAPIADSNPIGSDDTDDLLARMSALRD